MQLSDARGRQPRIRKVKGELKQTTTQTKARQIDLLQPCSFSHSSFRNITRTGRPTSADGTISTTSTMDASMEEYGELARPRGVPLVEGWTGVVDVIQYLDQVEETDRYQVQSQLLEQMLTWHEKGGDMIEAVFEYVKEKGDYQAHLTKEQFDATWKEVSEIVKQRKEARSRKAIALDTVKKTWGGEAAQGWIADTEMSGNYLDSVRCAAKALAFEDAVLRVNASIIQRITAPKRGVQTSPYPISSDWARALKMGVVPPLPTRRDLRKIGLQVGRWGLLEESSLGHVESEGSERGVDTGGEGDGDLALPEGEIEAGDVEMLEASSTTDLESDFESEDGAEEEQDEMDSRDAKHAESTCSCSEDVTRGWKHAISRKAVVDQATAVRLLAKWATFEEVCFLHARWVGGKLGLRTKQLDAIRLNERLLFIHQRSKDIGDLKAKEATYRWFRVKSRPTRQTDALGPYKFFTKVDLAREDFCLDQDMLKKDFGIEAGGE